MFSIILFIVFLTGTSVYFFIRKKKREMPQHDVPTQTEWDLKCIAIHEAGHAVCSFFSPEQENLILITIDPTNKAFGMIRTQTRLHHNATEISLRGQIATLLAGRLAEQIFLNITTTCCIHDLASASFIATNMVTRFGMGKKLGLSALNDTDNLKISEQHRMEICSDIQQIIHDAEHHAEKILLEHKETVKTLAKKLLVQKTLSAQEISLFFEEQSSVSVQK